ncbi:hypothetical protein [Neobacillus sp. 19]|uniref:hypothetical protein n=1 Tax=Neobacillus sp. 19 TaxID=3394458 RepID=UPI003BF6F347
MKKYLISAFFALFFIWGVHSQASAANGGTHPCDRFSHPTDPLVFWYTNGFSATNDPYNLDPDKNGVPCGISKQYYDSFLKTVKGWKASGGKWYYYQPGSKTPHRGWLHYLKDWYYLDGKGIMQTGWLKWNGRWYLLSPSGEMKTGWALDKGTWYFLDSSGSMKTGWLQDKGKWYYLEASGAMRSAALTVNGVTYFFESSGAMKTGWIKHEGKWYYYDTNGPKKGWLLNRGNWYYLDSKGVMKTGWLASGSTWYYLSTSGAMHKGWLHLGNSTYYLNDDSGGMLTGWQFIGYQVYYFYPSGAMAVNTTIDGKELGPDGALIFNDPYIEKLNEIASQYGVYCIPIYDYLNNFYMYFFGNDEDNITSVATPKGLATFQKPQKDLAIDVVIALGLQGTADELRADLDKALSEKQDVSTENWYIYYDTESGGFMIIWGELLQEIGDELGNFVGGELQGLGDELPDLDDKLSKLKVKALQLKPSYSK